MLPKITVIYVDRRVYIMPRNKHKYYIGAQRGAA